MVKKRRRTHIHERCLRKGDQMRQAAKGSVVRRLQSVARVSDWSIMDGGGDFMGSGVFESGVRENGKA